MYQLLYASTARQAFNDIDLITLLKKARQKNTSLNITGLLLYKQGKFMQLLEGEEAAVKQLFAAIKQDARHRDVIVLLEKRRDTTLFSDWSMGFVNLESDFAKSIPGYSGFLDTPLNSNTFIDDPALTMQFLYIFKFAKMDD